ncbi:GNAT family N-acetyltransferase [Bacillus spongiae]|uniref:GNAT family N-acetyltransferase n=1 Tax=Bacillus spongiae TaxID=2683610 RepID=A0ABU8HFW6_9BACI
MNYIERKHRVELREMKETDWKAVHQYASQERVSKYQTWGPNSEEQSKAFVEQVLIDSKAVPRTRFAFAVVLKESENMIGVGQLAIRDFANHVGEISYIINPDYWGNGYATEVAKELINRGFTEWKLHRIFATCDPRNIGSRKVLEKVEMVREGRMRETILLQDGWRDSLLYSVLRHEWKEIGDEGMKVTSK